MVTAMAMAMATARALVLVTYAVATFGCGGDDSDIDASVSFIDGAVRDGPVVVDADLPDAALATDLCPPSYGPASVAVTFMVGEESDGFDLDGADDPDGDGMPDNIIGSDEGLRNLLNVSINQSLDDGTMRQLTELRDLTGLGQDDADATLVLYGGVDSDQPPVLGDDFGGDEDYYFARLWVELDDCAAKSAMEASFAGGVVTASADEVMFFVASLGGFLDLADARMEASIAADTKGARTAVGKPGRFGGALKQCPLASGPGFVGFSAQQDLANIFEIQPDIDLDGDGLETILADSAGIISCTDGDGTTVIEGELCGCDPRMADGYSIVFVLDTRGAAIIGPAPQ
jgi:hypothetical protein